MALAPITGQFSAGVVSLAGAASVASSQTVVLACRTIEGTTANFDDARLWATATGSLHATLPLPID